MTSCNLEIQLKETIEITRYSCFERLWFKVLAIVFTIGLIVMLIFFGLQYLSAIEKIQSKDDPTITYNTTSITMNTTSTTSTTYPTDVLNDCKHHNWKGAKVKWKNI